MTPATATGAEAPLRVRKFRAGDERAIVDLIEICFGVRWPADRWRRWFEDGPHGLASIFVLEQGGAVVGHMSHIGMSAFVDGRRVVMGRGGPTMVHPGCQGQGGMRILLEAFLADDHGFALRANFPNDEAKVLMQRYGGGRHVGQIPRFVRSRSADDRAGAVARCLVRSGATELYAKAMAWPSPRGLKVTELTELGPDVDALAEASASFARCIRVRDAEYLTWRWLGRPDQPATVLGARDRSGALRGLVVCTVNEAGHGHIVDALALDARALRALLIAGANELFGLGCARVVLDYLDPRPWARGAVLRAGFLPWGTGMDIIVRAFETDRGIERGDAWFLTAGDTERC